MAYVDPRRRTNHPLRNKASGNTVLPPETVAQLLISDGLLVLSILSAKHWLLARGVGSLWLSINTLSGAGVGALAYLVIKGRIVLRGDIPWKTILSAAGTIFAQQIALFYSSKRLDASRILFVAPFIPGVIRQLLRTHSLRDLSILLVAIGTASLVDANFSRSDLYATLTGYIGLLVNGGLQVASSYIMPHLTNSFESPQIAQAISLLAAATCTIPIHLLGRTIGLLPPYPYIPILALATLPLIAFVLLYYYPKTIAKSSAYNPLSAYKLSFLPIAILTCILGPLFARHLALSDIPFAFLFYHVFQPTNLGSKSASEPTFKLLRGYLNTIISNPESRKIFYFLVINLAYMLVQMLYGVWTNSLGLISDAIHMAFDCMAIAMGLFASVMATWKPNERFTYGYGRVETLSGFANGIFLILISVFIIVEAIQRLIDPPQMNTRQLLLVSTVGLAVNLFGMFAMGGHAHHGHSHSHGGHGHSHASEEHDHSHDSPLPAYGYHDGAGVNGHHDHEGHSHDHGHGHDEEHHHSHDHGHSHDNSDHEHDHSHSHSHGAGHSHLHSRSNAAAVPFTPEIRLESPTDDKKNFFTSDSGPPSSIPYTPTVPYTPSIASNLPFSPVTPSYSFTYDDHLQQHHPETSHSHSHGGHEGHSHNMRGVFLHVMADTLGSVGVIISTILINIYGWTGFDPIASIFIAVLIAASVFPLVMDTGRVLALDLGGKEVEVERALQEVSGLWGVQSYSDARFWPLEQGRIVGSLHVQIMPGLMAESSVTEGANGHAGFSKLDRVRDGVEHVLKSRIKGLEELVVQLDG